MSMARLPPWCSGNSASWQWPCGQASLERGRERGGIWHSGVLGRGRVLVALCQGEAVRYGVHGGTA